MTSPDNAFDFIVVGSGGGSVPAALVMHEVGHTLGLRHNFRGSAGITAAQLADRDHTERYGHGVSVMDYAPPALSLDPRQQGHFYSPTIGSYDRWAITYGYAEAGGVSAGRTAKGAASDAAGWTPDIEINALRTIASRAAEPGHLYASDEDAGFGAAGLDPTVSRYDMTDDPLAWARERVTLIDGLFDSLETRVVAPGDGYGRLRRAFVDLLAELHNSREFIKALHLSVVSKYEREERLDVTLRVATIEYAPQPAKTGAK